MSEGHQEIIIIKRHGDHEDGHHGGAWKIALADFMTAMMALFLVMWLINSTSKEQKQTIAEYFNPVKLAEVTHDKKGLRDPHDTPSEPGAEGGKAEGKGGEGKAKARARARPATRRARPRRAARRGNRPCSRTPTRCWRGSPPRASAATRRVPTRPRSNPASPASAAATRRAIRSIRSTGRSSRCRATAPSGPARSAPRSRPRPRTASTPPARWPPRPSPRSQGRADPRRLGR